MSSACAQQSVDAAHVPGLHSDQPAASASSYRKFPIVSMQICIATWVFVLGACFGSFLNVVIYRLPAGMSLGKPKSRCPKCETPLAVKDNIPVLGWLWLRGKCRYCSSPIPTRYPTIEAVCGGIFLVLMFVELLTGAANLPMRHPDHFHVHPGFWLVWFMKWDLMGIYLYHCCLLVVVLAVAMIGYDGHSSQKRLTVFGVTVGIVFALFNSELRPIPAASYPVAVDAMKYGFWWTEPMSGMDNRLYIGVAFAALLDGLIGVLAGWLAGRLLKWQVGSTDSQTRSGSSIDAIATAFVIVGAFLGWQACGTLCLVMLPYLAACQFFDRNQPPVEESPEAAEAAEVAALSAEPAESGVDETSQIVNQATSAAPAVVLNKSRRSVQQAAPVLFAVVFAFILNWKRLDDASWMIGYAGWDFLPLQWWVEWLLTCALMFVFATGVRVLLSRSVYTEVNNSLHPGG